MSRARLCALTLAAAAAACGDSSAPAPTIAFRQPSALAVFDGYTLDAPAALRPYLVVANAGRNDLTVIDASDDTAVEAPIRLRALVIPVADRPALLASAPLGDGEADLLVAVSAGSSALQLVRTWTPANEVVDGASVDVGAAAGLPGADIVAVAPLPTLAVAPGTPGSARLAVALAGRRVAVVEYRRGADLKAIEPVGLTVSAPLAFQPLALAALPDDPDVAGVQTDIYAATLDELVPGSGLFGVAAISADLATVRPLDARGPTRLVAAARLRERSDASTAFDGSAFDGQLPVRRVYAVPDESGCGPTRRIDCGVVTLDPTKTTGGDAIPDDPARHMAYRAPMRVPGRIAALAVAQPPAQPIPGYAPDLMRLYAGATPRPPATSTERATTGVAAVATEAGNVYFLDLGRFETVTETLLGDALLVGDPTSEVIGAGTDAARLWPVRRIVDERSFPATAAEAAATITVTPGHTPADLFSVAYQDPLSVDLTNRAGEAGLVGTDVWIAMQRGVGAPAPGRSVREVVRLFHPALGIHAGDRVVVKAEGIRDDAALPDCTGEEFEAEVAGLLVPSETYPGGALRLTKLAAPEAWGACFDNLASIASGGVTGLDVSIRAGGLVLSGAEMGYAGRPTLGAPYALEYPAGADEDALAVLCPAADWDGSFPVPAELTCAGTACARGPASDCEKLVLARKARRLRYLCDEGCLGRFPVLFAQANGPALELEVDVQSCAEGVAACDAAIPAPPRPLARGMRLSVRTAAPVAPLAAPRPDGSSPVHPSGAIAFDRSRVDPAAGYRFLFSYPADVVLDVTPSTSPVGAVTIR